MKSKLLLLGLILLVGTIFLIYSGESAIAQTDQMAVVPVGQIIIKYKDEANLNQAAQAQESAQIQRLTNAADVAIEYFRPMSGDAHVLRLPERMPIDQVLDITEKLSSLPEVEFAEPDYIMFPMGETINTPLVIPNDPQYSSQWHYFAPTPGNYGVNAPAAWDITTGSSSIYVAVLDTGITDHSDLSGRWTGGYDMVSDPLIGNDGDGRDSDPHDTGDWITSAESSSGFFAGCRVTDSSWHGTHVAGTIGAASNNSLGVSGLNWVSQIIPVRVLGKCGGFSSDIIDGITWAAGLPVTGVPTNPNPAQVINMSLGGSGSCSTAYQNAVNGAYGAGSVVVVAAGNSSADAGGYQPASCNNVITVASNDRGGDLAYYSNYGATVEITAPGGETNTVNSYGVLSTLNSGTQGPSTESYAFYQGTSMAAPHVAGIASLMLSLDPTLTPAEVLSHMQSTVTAFPGGSSCNLSNCGSGIINAASVLAAIGNTGPDAPGLPPIDNADGNGDYTVAWSAVSLAAQPVTQTSQPLSVTDVYTIYLPLVMNGYSSTTYTLQEDDNAGFATPTTVYSGSGTFWNATGKSAGTYYYRVMTSNSDGDSIWSNIESVTVNPTGTSGFTNGDFESGSTGWTEFSTHGWDIIVTSPDGLTAHSGSYIAWLGGDYDDTSYIEQQVTIAASAAHLVYWHWIASEDVCGFDVATVLVNGIAVDAYDLCETEDTDGWVRQSIDLSAYAGQSVALRIRVETDGSLNSNLFVDDVSLQAAGLASDLDNFVPNFDASITQSKSGIAVQGEKP